MKSVALFFLVTSTVWAASPFSEQLYLQRTYDGQDFTIPFSSLVALQTHIKGLAIHQGHGDSLHDPRELDSHELLAIFDFDDESSVILRFKNLALLDIGALYDVARRQDEVTVLLAPKPLFDLGTGGRMHTESLEGVFPAGGILRAWL